MLGLKLTDISKLNDVSKGGPELSHTPYAQYVSSNKHTVLFCIAFVYHITSPL